jgi:membrane fusion protein, heavy metal efflux system
MKKITTFVYSTLVLSSFTLLSACKKETAKEEAVKFQLSDSLYNSMITSPAITERVAGTLQFTGKVQAFEDHQVIVAPLVDGIIDKLTVQLGDYVQKGQILAVVQSAEVADVESQTISAKSDLLSAQKNLQVSEDLFKAGLASEKDVVLARNEVEKAKATLKRAQDVNNIYGIRKSLYSVKAPISGYIIEKNPNITDKMAFRESEIGSFFTIANLSEVQIIANVFESDIAKIKLKADAQVKILAYPDELFHGKIDKINNVLDPESRTIQVRINLPNPSLKLKPEMFAQINIAQEGGIDAIAIPAEAVILSNNKNYALVYKDRSNIEIREVKIMQTSNGKAYISEGVKNGEKIISRNQLLIHSALTN